MRINLTPPSTPWKASLVEGYQTKRLNLNLFKRSDIEWFSRDSGNELMYRFVPDIQNDTDLLTWFESVYSKTNYLFYTIHIKKTCKAAGFFMFNMCPDKKLRIGAFLHPEFWDKGYTTELLCGLISFLKDIEFEHSLFADSHVKNHAARHVLLNAGFIATKIRSPYLNDMKEYALHM